MTPESRAPARLAIIGLGRIADAQLQALTFSKGWQLVGAADIDRGRRALLPAPVPFFPSAAALLDGVDADLVLVATPTPTHFALGCEVLSSGHDLLLEKPCCASASEFETLAELAQRHGRFFHVALHALHARDLHWYLDHRAALFPEAPDHVHCRFFDPYVDSGRLLPHALALGGSWQDSGINALAVVAKLLGDAQLGYAQLTLERSSRGAAVDGADDLHARVELAASGSASTRVTIETSWLHGLDSKTTALACSRNGTTVLLDHSGERVRVTRGGVVEQVVALGNGRPRLVNHYIGVLAEAREALARRRPNTAFARDIHRLLFAAAGAAHRGNPWH